MRSHKQILTFKNTSSVNARCFATKLLRRGALPPSPSGEGFDKYGNNIATHNEEISPTTRMGTIGRPRLLRK
jgi:hypothetical protein